MAPNTNDERNDQRRSRDEAIVAQPPLPPLDVPPNVIPTPMESHLRPARRRPVALTGVVENGLVRLLDPGAKLPERSRVIVVAEGT